MIGILKYHRVNSVVSLDYAPTDLTKHEAWLKFNSAITAAAMIDLVTKTKSEIAVNLLKSVSNKHLFSANISSLEGDEKTDYTWRSGIKELAHNLNLKDAHNNLGKFPLIGLYPW